MNFFVELFPGRILELLQESSLPITGLLGPLQQRGYCLLWESGTGKKKTDFLYFSKNKRTLGSR